MPSSKFFYGGQAVIEGVMIRGQRFYSVAVRGPTGTIHSQCQPIPSLYTGWWRRIPLVRGIIVLAETLILGMKALSYSANASLEEGQEIGKWGMVVTLALSTLIGVSVFFLAPVFLIRGLDSYISSSLLSNILEGIIRMAFFLVYIIGIGQMKDIKRVFAYHGAEHMTVHAHEQGQPLTVNSVRHFSTAHARCGTAFLLTVFVVAIIIFALLGRPDLPLRVISRVLLLPVIAGVAYELIRFSGAHSGNMLVRAISTPSLALQALTTRQPDDEQMEVAIHAMETAMAADMGDEPATSACGGDAEVGPSGAGASEP